MLKVYLDLLVLGTLYTLTDSGLIILFQISPHSPPPAERSQKYVATAVLLVSLYESNNLILMYNLLTIYFDICIF